MIRVRLAVSVGAVLAVLAVLGVLASVPPASTSRVASWAAVIVLGGVFDFGIPTVRSLLKRP